MTKKVYFAATTLALCLTGCSSLQMKQELEWKTSNGQFDINNETLEAIGRENYIWLNSIYNNFEMSFYATKAPNSDFRINIGSPIAYSNRNQGSFFQILVPWEGGDSRIDYFNNGRIKHISTGLKNIDKDKYHVRVTMNNKLLKIWIDNQLHIDFQLNQYKEGHIGFSEMLGVRIENFKITK